MRKKMIFLQGQKDLKKYQRDIWIKNYIDISLCIKTIGSNTTVKFVFSP